MTNTNEFPISLMGLVDWQEQRKSEHNVTLRTTYTNDSCNEEAMLLMDESGTKGVLFGLSLNVVNSDSDHRWHEACDFFQIDDSTDLLIGTGLEDYFCLAWGLRRDIVRDDFGVVHRSPHEGMATLGNGRANPRGEFSMYRFKPFDYIGFNHSIKFYFGGIQNAAKLCRLENGLSVDFRSVAFWYSIEGN